MNSRTIIAIGATLLAAIINRPSALRASENDRAFNRYIIQAYEGLRRDSQRSHRGYEITSWFTKNLNYGNDFGAITAHNAPFTMCNAAVTETLVEAINLYAKDHQNWSPQTAIPASSWNNFEWQSLKPHLFSHSYFDYPPLEGIPIKEIPDSLKKDIRKFHSEGGMYQAFEKFGLGHQVEFKDAQPGDVITLDRAFVNKEGAERFSGHSVIFLGFLDRNQKIQQFYTSNTIVGFKYFSSQGSKTDGGLGERWAYFKGKMCPFVAGYQLPDDLRRGGCTDAVDSPENRAANPVQLSEQKRDCCIKRDGPDGLRVARLLSPPQWSYGTAQASVAKQHSELQERIREFIENRKSASLRIGLIAKGANIVEAKKPEIAKKFIDRINKKFGVDLRTVSTSGTVTESSPKLANEITRITPNAIIVEANKKVTESDRRNIRTDIEQSGKKAIQRLNDASQSGIANIKLNGQSTD